jgi:hypothetical protein|tara:strand:+ start:42 stop:1223 length:1182 start_codon:yes stop_codon:yes gene_type:complete
LTLSEFLVFVSGQALANPKIYLQPGHNGPYNDHETPVRNFGHWLITFSKCFELTGKQIYLDKIRELAEFLISDNARPFGYSFHHRYKESKDKCNGLIGQAWTIESLVYASSVLDDMNYAYVAEEVFSQHNFNEKLGLWNRLETNGLILSIDETFNHQLWFAACASLLGTPRREEIRERIIQFMNLLSENLSVLDNGLIYHPIERRINYNGSDTSYKTKIKNSVKSFLFMLWNKDRKSTNSDKEYRGKMTTKSVGYHQFNMYAFAILKESFPDHPFWLSPRFQSSVDYLISNEFKNEISENRFGYPYNPPGFEVPYALSVFTEMTEGELIKISSWYINEQFKRCYNTQTRMLDKNIEDPLTLTARVYEVTRLPISILERIEIKMQSIGDFSQID